MNVATILGNMFSHSDTPAPVTLYSLMSDFNISSDQLDIEIEKIDIAYLAGLFDDVELYLYVLGLTISEQVNVKKMAHLNGNQVAMAECLSLWRQHNPSLATLRTLVDILLKLRKEDVAVEICGFFYPKIKSSLSGIYFQFFT